MEDTPFESRNLIHDILMSKTIEERVLMCAELYEEAKELAKMGMPDGLPIADQEAYIFKRIHGALPDELIRQS